MVFLGLLGAFLGILGCPDISRLGGLVVGAWLGWLGWRCLVAAWLGWRVGAWLAQISNTIKQKQNQPKTQTSPLSFKSCPQSNCNSGAF